MPEGMRKRRKRKSWCEDQYTMMTYMVKRRRRRVVEKQRKMRKTKRRKRNPWCEEH
jgi:hypothetical protein